jgi:uncharacterized protein with HEPN domain
VSSRTWQQRVQDVLEAIASIQRYTLDKTIEDFYSDGTLLQAVLYNFVIIGEATRHIPVEIQSRYPHIPWRFMIDMRNVVAHEYFQVESRRVWETIQEDLPPLPPQLQELLRHEDLDE